jgi:hypothetical protein
VSWAAGSLLTVEVALAVSLTLVLAFNGGLSYAILDCLERGAT